MATNFYKIGTSYGGVTSLPSLTVPVPFPYHEYTPFSKAHELASGATRGNGTPMIKWTWKFLTRAQRGQLRTFCASPAISSSVWISQLDGEGTARVWTAQMNWPVMEDYQAERVGDFSIIFKRLVVVTS